MRNLLTIIFLFCTLFSSAQIDLGCNLGYFGPARTDQQLYDLQYNAGIRSTRSTVSMQYYLQYGFSTFSDRLQYPYTSKGMRNSVFNLTATSGPIYAGEGTTTAGGHRTILPGGLYLEAFNADGSINTNNLYAKYCYDVVQAVGPYFTYFEVWNEPDINNTADSFEDSTQSATSWEKVEPNPATLTNMYASIEDYIQLCKIANEVVKKYQPNAKICTGGIGSPWFYMWFLRKGGGQWIDENSVHKYPYWDWVTDKSFNRNSDFAMNDVIASLNGYRAIETQLGTPHVPMIMTETNIPRWPYITKENLEIFPKNKQWGSDSCQRNFTIKMFAKGYQWGLQNIYLYQTGETGDSGLNNGSAGSEIDAMGIYKNLVKAAPGSEVFTNQGIAIKSMQSILANYKVNTKLLPAQSGTDGVEFDSAGQPMLLLWAVTNNDINEASNSVYNLPGGGEWDVSDYTGKHLRICVDTVHLHDPVWCHPHNTTLALLPPPRDTTVPNYIETQIFPNPARSSFTVKVGSKTFGGVLITIFDMYGTCVKFYTGTKNSFYFTKEFPTTFPAAIYTVKININGSQQDIKKLIIIK